MTEGAWAPWTRDVRDALRFFTRLPVAGADGARLDIGRIAWAAPVAGAIVGLIGAGVLAAASLLGLPHVMRAGLATAAIVAATGALHEDGLADVADGFGGGTTRERKLAIMRDSRIGAYGAIAVSFGLILRVGALASATRAGFFAAASALILVSALSRAGALMPLAALDPARADGAGASAGRIDAFAFAAACGMALAITFVVGLPTVGLGRALMSAAGAALGAAAMTALASRQIGGQTGDVAGAAQQWAEIGAWCGLLIEQSAA